VKTGRISFILLLAAVFAQGCQSVLHDPGTRVKDENLLLLLRSKLESMFPESFRAVHRVILTAGNRQFDLDGYILVKRPGRLRLLAKGSMGITAFDVVREPDGRVDIAKNPAGLRDSWIEEGAARDASVLYLSRAWPEAFLVQHGSVSVGLAHILQDGAREEFVFDSASRRLIGYVRSRGSKCLYKMEFSKEEPLPQWPQPVARIIKVTDYALNYRLTIQVVDLRTIEIADKLFRVGP
jgi:hypothetical protein